jgi:hypothetical protein
MLTCSKVHEFPYNDGSNLLIMLTTFMANSLIQMERRRSQRSTLVEPFLWTTALQWSAMITKFLFMLANFWKPSTSLRNGQMSMVWTWRSTMPKMHHSEPNTASRIVSTKVNVLTAHQNGVAERAICTVTQWAHAQWCCTRQSTGQLRQDWTYMALCIRSCDLYGTICLRGSPIWLPLKSLAVRVSLNIVTYNACRSGDAPYSNMRVRPYVTRWEENP